MLMKYDVFPAANLGQVYSKQIFFFFEHTWFGLQ